MCLSVRLSVSQSVSLAGWRAMFGVPQLELVLPARRRNEARRQARPSQLSQPSQDRKAGAPAGAFLPAGSPRAPRRRCAALNMAASRARLRPSGRRRSVARLRPSADTTKSLGSTLASRAKVPSESEPSQAPREARRRHTSPAQAQAPAEAPRPAREKRIEAK